VTPGEARRLFPVLERVAYLNAGTFGPLPRAACEAMEAELQRDCAHGRHGLPYFERVLGLREELRARLATLVGAEPAQVALTASTTEACNLVAAGLGLGVDDEVVTTTEEHFGLVGALHASGARVVVAPAEPAAILSAVTPRTRLLALSQVLWTRGLTLPVRELREGAGVPVLVDGAQSVGAIPVDATGIDFFTISGQKWLCGPEATGALVVADPERLRIARPSYFSQSSVEPTGTFVPREGAARFDPGWIPASALVGLLAALDVAPEWAHERAAEQARQLRELLAAHVELAEGDATLVSFRHPEASELVSRLLDEGVVVRDIPGTGLVRASCGWWTSDDDLRRLVEAVAGS
jgi:L-cysteine/cystine lyase